MSAADGTWNVKVKTPMGEQESVLTLKAEGPTLTGTAKAMGVELPIEDASVEGNKVIYKIKVTTPMPMTLETEAEIDGDTMSGKTKAGSFGAFDMTASRA